MGGCRLFFFTALALELLGGAGGSQLAPRSRGAAAACRLDNKESESWGALLSGERLDTWVCSLLGSLVVGLSGVFPLLVIPLEMGAMLRSEGGSPLLGRAGLRWRVGDSSVSRTSSALFTHMANSSNSSKSVDFGSLAISQQGSWLGLLGTRVPGSAPSGWVVLGSLLPSVSLLIKGDSESLPMDCSDENDPELEEVWLGQDKAGPILQCVENEVQPSPSLPSLQASGLAAASCPMRSYVSVEARWDKTEVRSGWRYWNCTCLSPHP